MTLATILLNWDQPQETISQIKSISLIQQDPVSPVHQIIMVDNNVTQAPVDFVKATGKQIEILRTEVNMGFAGGINVAVKKAMELGHSHALLLNNDATIACADLCHLFDVAQKNPEIGALGPLIEDYIKGQPSGVTAGGRDPVLFDATRIPFCASADQDNIQNVGYVPGTISIIALDAYEKVGGLNEEFFFSGEMAEYSIRLRKHGFKVQIDRRVKGYHHLEPDAPKRRTLYLYYSLRNRWIIARNAPIRSRFRLGARSALTFLKRCLAGDIQAARAVFLSQWHAAIGRYGNQNKYFGFDL